VSAAPIRVYLLDDHRTVLWGLRRLIEGEQPRMEVVGSNTSADQALAEIPDARPDVILLDLDLGDRSGLDLLPKLRDISTARVLVLTGMRDGKLHEQAIMGGACGVVTKESPAETLLLAIEKASAGEMWLDRNATARIFMQLSRRGRADASDPVAMRIATLTSREREVIAELAGDAAGTTKTIASRLFMSEHTLRNHLTSIYDKLEVGSRVELYAFANRHGLAGTPDRGEQQARS
jgi:two-component system, NarL family, nitrate/nitrite response regulator NarL